MPGAPAAAAVEPFTPFSSWVPQTTIASAWTESAPTLATASDGRIWAAWQEGTYAPRRFDVLVASSAAGSKNWTRPTVISGDGLNYTPEVVAGPDGLLAVTWLKKRDFSADAYALDVMASIFTPGSGWSGPITVQQSTEDFSGNGRPGAAFNEAGDLVIAWLFQSVIGSGQAIDEAKVGVIPRGETQIAEVHVLETQSSMMGGRQAPALTLRPDGTAVIAYATQCEIHLVQGTPATGSWQPPVVADDVNWTGAICPVAPELATTPSGTSAVAWQEAKIFSEESSSANGAAVRVRTLPPASSTWTPVEDLALVDVASAYDFSPRLTAHEDGFGVLITMPREIERGAAAFYDVVLRESALGAQSWNDPVTVASVPTNRVGSRHLVYAKQGPMVAWQWADANDRTHDMVATRLDGMWRVSEIPTPGEFNNQDNYPYLAENALATRLDGSAVFLQAGGDTLRSYVTLPDTVAPTVAASSRLGSRQRVRIFAKVSAGSLLVQGRVALYRGSRQIVAPVNLSKASPSTRTFFVQLPVGRHTLTVRYLGNGPIKAATSAPITVRIVSSSAR